MGEGISPVVFRENSLQCRVIMFGSSESRRIFAPEISEDAYDIRPVRNKIKYNPIKH